MEKERGLWMFELKAGAEVMEYRHALRAGGAVYEDIENVFEDGVKKPALAENDERNGRESEILKIRQKVYAKLSKGLDVFPLVKIFKKKVEKYLENYRADLSYYEENYWRTKVLITEKAVGGLRHKKEIKSTKHSKTDEILAPTVKNMFDKIKDELENLKKIVDVKEENVAEKVSKVSIIKSKRLKPYPA